MNLQESVAVKKQSIFQNRNFMLLLVGQIVSNLGNAVHSVAVAWFIMGLVGEGLSGTYMAILGTCTLIPYIVFGPISGVFVDRISRKLIIAGTDIIRGALILSLAAFVYFNFYPLAALFAVTVLSALFGSFFNPAIDASIPNVVEEKDLTQANSVNGMSRQLTWIIGGAISGFLYYKIGVVGIFIVNGLSFILSGLSEMFIKLPPVKKKESGSESFWEDFKGGIQFVRSKRIVMVLMAFALVLNFLFNPIFQIIFPKTMRFTLETGAQEYGIFQAIIPIGAMLGMMALSAVPKLGKSYKVVLVSMAAQSALLAGFGVPILPSVLGVIGKTNVFVLYCMMILVSMVANSLVNVPVFTAFQKIVPDEYRGRFFGLLNTLTQGIVPLGLAVFGILSDVVHPAAIFMFAGGVSLALSIWMMFVKEFKELV